MTKQQAYLERLVHRTGFTTKPGLATKILRLDSMFGHAESAGRSSEKPLISPNPVYGQLLVGRRSTRSWSLAA